MKNRIRAKSLITGRERNFTAEAFRLLTRATSGGQIHTKQGFVQVSKVDLSTEAQKLKESLSSPLLQKKDQELEAKNQEIEQLKAQLADKVKSEAKTEVKVEVKPESEKKETNSEQSKAEAKKTTKTKK